MKLKMNKEVKLKDDEWRLKMMKDDERNLV